jgi:hypothetical protein
VSLISDRAAGRALLCVVLTLGFAQIRYSDAAPVRVDATIVNDRLEASYNASPDFVHSADLDGYLSLIVRRLQEANPDAASLNVRIHALNLVLPYAFVLANGACYISTGLIARLDNESQLAAMIATPLAAMVRHDTDKLTANERERSTRNLVPNLLLITLTAGFAGPAIAKGNVQARAEQYTQLQMASDAAGLQWLASAGYDSGAGPAALLALRDGLSAEQRSGTSDLSDPGRLTARAEEMHRLLSAFSAATEARASVDPTHSFDKFSALYAQRQAASDIDRHPVSVVPALDRLDTLYGASAMSAFLRAELIRRDSADPLTVPAAIDAYERCIAHIDAPPVAYRELAFLYRRAGNTARARQNFTAYLAHAPNASDAPIVRSYLENP